MDLYKNIKKRRKELNLTQSELAEKSGYTSKSSIARIENGEIDLPLSKIKDIALALSVTPSELLGWDDLDNAKAKSNEIDKAIELFEQYQHAEPRVQSAVDLLLKPPQSDA